ncbi:MAG: hypothetical protein JOZ83_05530 [Silvibacterium sp.]|nr:hypothetical protein [Silvibacterium sp.]
MFARHAPEDWAQIMLRVVHIHGKFYGFDESGEETSIDLARVLEVFLEGYSGFLSSEWERHAYTDAVSGFEMVEKHQQLCRTILDRFHVTAQRSASQGPRQFTRLKPVIAVP